VGSVSGGCIEDDLVARREEYAGRRPSFAAYGVTAEEARRFGLAMDVDTATFFIGRETLVPAERSELGSWRNKLYRAMASNALSPARFYHLPPNRVVELGTQITI